MSFNIAPDPSRGLSNEVTSSTQIGNYVDNYFEIDIIMLRVNIICWIGSESDGKLVVRLYTEYVLCPKCPLWATFEVGGAGPATTLSMLVRAAAKTFGFLYPILPGTLPPGRRSNKLAFLRSA